MNLQNINPIRETISKKGKLRPDQIEFFSTNFPSEWKEYQDSLRVNQYLNKFITNNPALLKVKEEVLTLSEFPDPVLIVGETGTGKELLANALHGERPGPFVAVNCAGFPEALIESELFGHVQGAFTDAKKDKDGLLLNAENGTIFLDEIGELPMPVQAKLLRALQEKKIRRVGADMSTEGELSINCRVVSATHRDLQGMIAVGRFREDLFWRIQTFTLRTEPIHRRTEDIVPIVRALASKERDPKFEIPIELTDKQRKEHPDLLDLEEFCEYLRRNSKKLTGNVRQIEAIVRNYHVLGRIPEL